MVGGMADRMRMAQMQGDGMQPPDPATQHMQQMEQIIMMATQILGRPPRDLQEAAQAVFASQPTDQMGSQLEGLGAQPPFLQGGQQMPQQPQQPMPFGMGPPMMPPQRR